MWPAVNGSWWRAEPSALNREKDADVGECRALYLVAAPTLTHQVVQLSRTVGWSDDGTGR